jgi:hypothetical protein
MLRKLIRLRSIAQVVHGNAATEIDVFESVSGFTMYRDQVLPHASECFGKWSDVGRLGSNVNVNSANFNQVRPLEPATKRRQHFGRGDAEL